MNKQLPAKLKSILLILFILLQLAANILYAQPNTSINRIYWSTLGYYIISNTSNTNTPIGKFGTSAGIGIEIQKNRLLLQSGLEIEYYSSIMNMGDTSMTKTLYDSDGDEYTGNFTFSNIKETQKILNIGIPLLIGYKSRKRFYFLAGEKIAFNVYCKNHSSSTVNTTGTYNNLIGNNNNGTLSYIPSHGLTDENRYITKKTNIKTQFISSIELGWALKKQTHYQHLKHKDKNKPIYRIALFFDYGIAPFNKNKTDELIVSSSQDYYIPTISNLLYFNNKTTILNSIYTGIKITVILHNKRNCHCYD